MWLLVNSLIFSMFVACCGKWQPAYMKLISADTYEDFVQDQAGDGVRVVYFYSGEFPGMKKFLTEMEKSAAILEIYDAKFALVDCSEYPSLGQCQQQDSFERVYVYRKGNVLLDVIRHAMFDVNSIVSNVLQVTLLMEVPILQSLGELENVLNSCKGSKDVIFSYQNSLGTLAHRILMEVIYAHRSQYCYGLTNGQETVRNLPGYLSNEESGIWLMRCKGVTLQDQSCPSVKYTGAVTLDNVARFFRLHDMTFIHYIGEDGDYNPFEDNGLHTVYVFYDKSTQIEATVIANGIIGSFFTQLGVIMVDVNEVHAIKFGYKTGWSLPAINLQPVGQNSVTEMSAGDIPIRFIAESINSSVPDVNVLEQLTSEMTPEMKDGIQQQPYVEQNVDKQDDEVAEFGKSLKDTVVVANKQLHFTELSSKSYFTTVNNDHIKRPVMVLFYVTFDARCQVLLPMFEDAASELSSTGLVTMAAVNCFDWTDLCQQVNVTVFPTLWVYVSKFKEPIRYSGMLSKKSLIQAMKLYSYEAPAVLETVEEVDKFVTDSVSDFVVLGGFLNDDTDAERAAFVEVASRFRGKLILGLATQLIGPEVCSKFNAKPPCVIVIRHQDDVLPYTVLRPTANVDELSIAIQHAQMESFPELTVNNFPLYNSLDQPFVIAFINHAELTANNVYGSLLPTIKHLIQRGDKADTTIYAWMNVSKSQAALSILKHHIEKPLPEELLVISRDKGTVHHFTGDVTEITVHNWIMSAVSGDIAANKFLTVKQWKPTIPPFDFISKIDAESLMREKSYDTNSVITDSNDEAGLPFELLDSSLENLVKEERSKLMRAQLHAASAPPSPLAPVSKRTEQAEIHDEF